ncbi:MULTISPECIES: amidohydrolase family protein [Clostridium]|jgi:imidazolonepropionase-like amidohydrolase|uniref:Amidohydrolase family protein n=1 Tax=Clostridium lapidicellarium TaxID=3240931 RepID=A0ABV4DY79_9CLOT|nr:amidohydrolase family protein [uncultured Clostridium sp.]
MNFYGIRCGVLIDGTGKPPLKDVIVIVKNHHIARIERNSSLIDPNIPIIDARNCTIIPGLIDSHKHVMNCGGFGIEVGFNLHQLKRNLSEISKGGVTSVLDLGSANIAPYLERLIGSKTRIYNAISILTCKGGYPQEYMPQKFYKMGSVIECDGLDEIKRNVRKLYKKGVSVIKTAVVSRTFDNRPQVNWTDRELRCLTDEAHSYGLNVCAHITYIKDYEQAAKCGVDSIHHAAFDGIADNNVLEIMIEKGIIFVPTLSLVDLIVTGLKERWIFRPDYDPAVNEKIKVNMRNFTEAYTHGNPNKPIGDFFVKLPKSQLEEVSAIQLENVRRYIALGGIVAMGTDSALGFSLHNTPTREIELLMKAGLSLTETIKASTLNSSKVFGMQKEIGSIEPMKRADMLIIDSNLENNIASIDKIKSVIINGNIVYERSKNSEKKQ